MKTLIAALATAAILAVPAHAQFGGATDNTPGNPADKLETERAAKARAETEQEYNDAMKRQPYVAPKKVDPWGSMRPSGSANPTGSAKR
jgi:hypothetical protein